MKNREKIIYKSESPTLISKSVSNKMSSLYLLRSEILEKLDRTGTIHFCNELGHYYELTNEIVNSVLVNLFDERVVIDQNFIETKHGQFLTLSSKDTAIECGKAIAAKIGCNIIIL